MLVSHEQTIKNYFSAFNEKNTHELQNLLSQNVLLEDWEVRHEGISNVIGAARDLFQKFPALKIYIVNLAFYKEFACAEISIKLNEDLVINVVDIFEFMNSKIHRIRAYKR